MKPSKHEKTILISVDHKWRDLAGYVYTKLLLEKLGYHVILIRTQFEKQYIDVYNPCAVIMIHLYDQAKNELVQQLKERNILVFIMPTEGIPTMKNVRKLAAGHFSDLSGIDLHFLWNKPMCELMKEGASIDPEKLCVVGVPRFDFYRPPLSNLLQDKQTFSKKYRLQQDIPIITWATNFTHAGFYKKNMAFLKKDWKTLQVDKVLDPEEIAQKDFVSRQLHFECIARLLQKIDNFNLMIKLHPSEDHTFYYQQVKRLPENLQKRIRIVHQQYIWDILNPTDILLKRSCTTGLEAWVLDKPTIELQLNPDEWYCSPEHASGSNQVTTYDELEKCVQHYLNGGTIPVNLLENRKQFIEKWCYQVDGKATQRFVTKIHEMIQHHHNRIHQKTSSKNLRFFKSLLLVWLLELTNFKIHNLKVYGLTGKFDKLGRYDKYFDRTDEQYWKKKLSSAIG